MGRLALFDSEGLALLCTTLAGLFIPFPVLESDLSRPIMKYHSTQLPSQLVKYELRTGHIIATERLIRIRTLISIAQGSVASRSKE